jgi:hypothetical protein
LEKILLAFVLMVLGYNVFAEEMIEKNITVTSTATEAPAARKDLQDQAVTKITEDLARDLMGAERYEKNKNIILNKIAKMSGRYISYVKPGDLTAATPGPGYSMAFLMKVSPSSLKTLLQNAGILNENDTLPVVLPLISFYDRVGVGTFKWWQPGDVSNKKFLVTSARSIENSLRQAFKRQQFHLVRPMDMVASQLIPNIYQNDRISPDDRDFYGRLFQAPLVIDGQVEFSHSQLGSNVYRIDIKMSAIQLSNNRPIADVSRKYETESGTFETVVDKKLRQVMDSVSQDLALQVFEAWQKGTVGTNIIRLTVRGEVPFQQREILKEKIRTQIPQIKNIKERMVTGNTLSYEVDSSSTPQELGQKLNSLDFNGVKFQTSSASDKEVVVDLKR